MKTKAVSGIMLTLLFLGMFTLAFNIQPVRASGTIYIRPDGTVEGTDKIQRDGDLYTFTANIYDSIVVEIDNIVIDGAGYTLQGTGNGIGIYLTGRSNVTIKNMEITEFYRGIYLRHSSNNTISGNNITNNNWAGIELYGSSSNTISRCTFGGLSQGIVLSRSSNNNIINNILITDSDGIFLGSYSNYNNITSNTANLNYRGIHLRYDSCYNTIRNNTANSNREHGIWVWESSYNIITNNTANSNTRSGIRPDHYSNYNTITNNTVNNNGHGIHITACMHNTIYGNDITKNTCGICLWGVSNNIIYHNNFVTNTEQVRSDYSTSVWDDGYPSGGNYWSDHVTVDDCCGINQDEPGSDGIVDEPYIIDDYNRDNYPLVEPWSPIISATVDIDPDTLNLKSNGEWITAYIELPEGYSVSDIDVSTIQINNTVPVDPLAPTQIGDYDLDGVSDLMVKSDRASIIEWLGTIDYSEDTGKSYLVTLTITGKVLEMTFEGSSTLKVLHK